ncbi:hypothetical protein ACQ4LE_008000, partial [Meloidogyne hapla]
MSLKLIILFSFISSFLILLVSSAEPQFRNPVNCANLPDGNYVWGCSRFYSICTNGRELAMNCYHNLKLNPGTNQCEEPHSIPICASGGSAYAHQLYRAKDPFTCNNKPNGEYESSVCSSTYITCDNGKKIERECPYGLAYNQKAGACDRKEKCKPDKGAPVHGNVRKMRASFPFNPFEDSFGGFEAPSFRFAPGPPAYVPPVYAPPAYAPPPTTTPPPVYVPATPAPPSYVPPQQPAPPAYAPPAPPAQPPAYAPPSYSPAPPPAYGPAPPPQFDCSSKPDGLYEVPSGGCTDKFWKCANQRAFLYQCPPNLAYYAVGKYCDYKFYVPACGGSPQPVQTSTAGPPPPPTYDCSKKSDGLYGAGNCTSSYFFYCSAGKTTVMQCASPQLVFDEVNQVCEYSGECGKQKPKPPSYGPAPPSPPSYGQPPAPPSFGPAPPSPPSYGQPPAPPSYGPAPPSPPSYGQPPAPPSYVPGGGHFYRNKRNVPQPPQYLPPQPIQPYVQPPISFNCSGKADGYYVKDGCSKDYYTCSNGIAYLTTCPGSLFFNIVKKQCDYKENCPPPPTPSPPISPPYSPPAPIPPPQTPPPPPISCKGRKDGFYYQKACEGYYYVCSGESAFTQYCPAGTLFEPVKAECTFKDECGKKPPQPYTPPPSVYTPKQISPSAPDTVKIPSSSYGEFNCHGKADGFYYQQNCQPFWITCTGGYTYKQDCALGTLFDPKQFGCTFAAECGKKGEGKYISTTKLLLSNNIFSSQQQQNSRIEILPSPQLIYSQPEILPTQQQNISLSNKCLNKIDGFYLKSKHCQNKYFVCSGKRQIELKCPEGLLFDTNIGQCEYSINCSKLIFKKEEKEKEENLSKNIQKYSQIFTTTTILPPPILPQSAGTFSCKGRIDGFYYKIACSPNFYICVGGFPQRLKCPDNLLFDPINVLCQYEHLCGKTINNSFSSPPRSFADFNCKGKRNGYYAKSTNNLKECFVSSHFYSCLNEQSNILKCPENLVFDINTVSCQYKETICPKNEKQINNFEQNNYLKQYTAKQIKQQTIPLIYSSPPPIIVHPAPSLVYSEPSQTGIKGIQLPLRPYNLPTPIIIQKEQQKHLNNTICLNKNLKLFNSNNGCNNYFYFCPTKEGEYIHKLDCPLGLFFDEDKQQCNFRENIKKCGGNDLKNLFKNIPTKHY